ncbi:MAG: hypothetical protein ABSH51_12775 [Solirubrobacteraceae bacterium]|jgi:hypothetical protein
MSAISSSAGVSTPVTGLPPTDPALEPASVRNGNQAAKNAYDTGLAFENVLVNELTQQLTATVPGLDGSTGDGLGGTSDDGLGGTGDDSGGGSSSALSSYSSLLPSALTSSIMSSGGTGVAMQIAESIDPKLAGR